jgi:hypothetical protein
MAWQGHRGAPKKYYTQTMRTGCRRIRIYFGAGMLGEIAALQDHLARICLEIRRRERDGQQEPQIREDDLKEGLEVALRLYGDALR